MTTATQIINQALGLLGIRSSADPVGGADAAIALERLNTMLDAWRVESLYAYATQTVTGTLPADTATRTIGPVGQLVLDPRPVRLEEGCKYTLDGLDYPIEPITRAQYEALPDKTVAGNGPEAVYYNAEFPAGTLYFYPVADAPVTLSLVVQVHLTAFADLATDYDLPPGYERALVYSLAEECAADFERDVTPTVALRARNARRAVKRANNAVPQLDVPHRGRRSDIENDLVY